LKPDPISSGGKKYKGRSVTSEKNHTVSNLNISLFDNNTRDNQWDLDFNKLLTCENNQQSPDRINFID